jgi:hypothetical protein
MVVNTNRASVAAVEARALSGSNLAGMASNPSVSFAQQLISALEAFLARPGPSPSTVLGPVDSEPQPGHDTGVRQFPVRVQGSSPGSSGTTPIVSSRSGLAATAGTSGGPSATGSSIGSATTAPATAAPATNAPTSTPAITTSATSSSATPHLANGQPVLNEADAYWATQPPEVQRLRDLSSESDRAELARQLAEEGFQIDVPIMVWGWDPLATMIVRQNQGYTWVPSAGMDPVSVAPGIGFPGLPSYDPAKPPAGAILVSTDWAKGFEKTDPWLYDSDGNPRASTA